MNTGRTIDQEHRLTCRVGARQARLGNFAVARHCHGRAIGIREAASILDAGDRVAMRARSRRLFDLIQRYEEQSK